MAVTSQRLETITYAGDINITVPVQAAANSASPGQIDLVTLSSGNTTINIPTGGSTPKACIIIPPSGNANTLTLKGVAGDTGILLHKTDPTTIAIDTGVTSFVLNAGATITGVRLVWS